MISPSLTLFVTSVHILGLIFGLTTLPDRVAYQCSWSAVGVMTGIGELLVMATSLASSTGCPGCPPSSVATRRMVIHWRPLCVRMAVHGSSRGRFNCVGSTMSDKSN